MPPAISRIVQALEPSATMAMAAKAKELKATGKTVYDLSLGEPDFDTPAHICEAAIEAMKAGHTHYTAASGIDCGKMLLPEKTSTKRCVSNSAGSNPISSAAGLLAHTRYGAGSGVGCRRV